MHNLGKSPSLLWEQDIEYARYRAAHIRNRIPTQQMSHLMRFRWRLILK